MPYKLSIKQRSNYLYITVTGDNTVDTVRSYLTEIRLFCQKHNCPNVLLVENLAGPGLDTLNIYNLASSNSAQASLVIGRLAYVDLNPAHKLEDMQFAEDVAVNRGLIVKVFSTIQAAQQWLREQAN